MSSVIVFELFVFFGVLLTLGAILFFSRQVSTKIRNVIYFLCFYVGSVFIVLCFHTWKEAFSFFKMPLFFVLTGQLLAWGLEKIKQPISFFKKWFLILFLFFGWLFGYYHELFGLFDKPGVLRTPIEIPFHLDNPNEKIDFMVKTTNKFVESQCYELYFDFYLKNTEDKHWTQTKEGKEDQSRLFQLVGLTREYKIDQEVPLIVHAQVFSEDQNKILFDQDVSEIRVSNHSMPRISKKITGFGLKDGLYRIVVKNKKMVDDFKDRKINLALIKCDVK
jgi:hypothetical protein